jgi:crossover junction endodeoxyribonuclease RuvC
VGITPKQYERLLDRVRGTKRTPEPVLAAVPPTSAARHEIVLGIDPSLRGTGYGVLRLSKSTPRALTFGTVRCSSNWERSRCLVKISETLREVVQAHRPTLCVVESLFYAQNLQTALIMGEARGAVLAAVAEAGLEIYEIAPRKVKQALVGYGAAQKFAVAKMVQRLLHLEGALEPDAADALALALAHAHEQSRYSFALPKRL